MPYAFEGGICTDPVEGAIEITEAQYEEALTAMMDGKAISIVDGFSVVEPGVTPPDPDLPLVERKRLASTQIDEAAEAARLRYITGGSGQAMTYQQKATEAAAALAATDPDPADYPLIVAEIGITAPTLLEVATVIDGAYQQWRVVGAAIEALRLGGKAAVAAAMTVEDVKAAADITWP